MRLATMVSIVALAFAAGAHATPRRGTLSGTVMRGPVTPVCVAELPCDEPAANVTLLFIQKGAVIVRAVTNAQGRYRVRLPPGVYVVRRAIADATIDRKVEPNHARV